MGKTIENKLQDPEIIKELYINQRMHAKDVAKELGVGLNTVRRAFERFGINKSQRFPSEFTPEQRSVLYGTVMGDGNLSLQSKGTNAYFRVEHSIKQKKWCQWKFNILKPFIIMPNLIIDRQKIRDVMGVPILGPSIKFSTVSTPLFTKMYHEYYFEGEKILTKKVLDKIDALALGTWFCDDGSYSQTINSGQKQMRIDTNSFSYPEHEMMQIYFKQRWNIEARISTEVRKKYNATYHCLSFRPSEAQKLIEIIRPHIIPEMQYKLVAEQLSLHKQGELKSQ